MTNITVNKPVEALSEVIIRFAGDSGDGMQLTGDRFTTRDRRVRQQPVHPAGFPGRDPRTRRHPAGGVRVPTALRRPHRGHPGRRADGAGRDEPGGAQGEPGRPAPRRHVIVDTDEFTKRNLAKVGYAVSPVEDGSLADYQVHAVKLTSLTVEAVAKVGLSRKDAERAKNMFALGLLSWLYHRPLEGTRRFLETKFGGKREVLRANLVALEAGWSYGETTEGFAVALRGQAGQPAARPVPHHPREPGAGLRAGRGGRAVRACRCSWGRTRSPRRPTSCTSCPR